MFLLNRNKFKPTYPRQEVLKEINDATCWVFCENLSLEYIQVQMNWLKKNLKLETMSLSFDEDLYFCYIGEYWRKKEERLLTRRQEGCYLNCMSHINNDRPGEAYHELHDFIDDCDRKGEFTSELEIKGIKLMVEAMNSKIEELGKGKKNYSQSE